MSQKQQLKGSNYVLIWLFIQKVWRDTYRSPHMGKWVPETAGLGLPCRLLSLPGSRVPPDWHWQHKTCDWALPRNGSHLKPPLCRAPSARGRMVRYLLPHTNRNVKVSICGFTGRFTLKLFLSRRQWQVKFTGLSYILDRALPRLADLPPLPVFKLIACWLQLHI